MWYREAQQGIMNLDRLFPGAEQAITNWLKNQVVLLPSGPNEVYDKNGYFEFENVEIPEFLKKYVSRIDVTNLTGKQGEFNARTKVLTLPKRVSYNQYQNLLSTVLHEIRHSIDPRNNNSSYMKMIDQKYVDPKMVLDQIRDFFKYNNKIPTYDEVISKVISDKGINANDYELIELYKKYYSKSAYDIALNSIRTDYNLYLNNPIEHSSQLGDIARLLSKQNLDAVRNYIKKTQGTNLTDIQLRAHLKNGLNPNSRDFEAYSQIIDQVSGNQGKSLSEIVKGTKDPKWQEQYLKQVSNAVSVYNKDNRFKGLVRKENRMQPGVKSNPKFNLEDNANAMKSRAAFFSKASQLEALAESNPKAWSRFIKFPMVSRMIPKNLSGIFKNIGTGSKALSQSLRQMPPQSPLWGLLEPALEFGLYQFGLYLENPSAYTLETPEQKTIKDLNAKINEIIANPKITDKRGYFIKNYGSYLKTLGSMEQNELLGKFPVMNFGSFMNIGKNIGQK